MSNNKSNLHFTIIYVDVRAPKVEIFKIFLGRFSHSATRFQVLFLRFSRFFRPAGVAGHIPRFFFVFYFCTRWILCFSPYFRLAAATGRNPRKVFGCCIFAPGLRLVFLILIFLLFRPAAAADGRTRRPATPSQPSSVAGK